MSALLGWLWLLAACPNGIGALPGGGAAAAPIPPAITALALEDGGRSALVGDGAGAVRRVEVDDGEPGASAEVARLDGGVVGLVARAGGGAAAASDAGALVLLAAGHEGPALPFARHPAGLQGIAVSPDGGLLAAAGSDGAILVFALASPEGGLPPQVARLDGHEGPVAAVAFAGGLLVSAGWDRTVRTWKLGERGGGRAAGRVEVGARELSALAALGGGASEGAIAVAAFDGAVHLLDARKLKAKARALPARPHAEWASALAAAPDRPLALAVAAAESALIVFDIADPARAREVPMEGAPAVAIVLPGAKAALVGRFDGTLARVALPEDILRAAPEGGR